MKPGSIIYINSPRLVFALLKIVEIINSRIISNRLILAIIEPIIVNQFLNEDGSFIFAGFMESEEVNIEKYWIIFRMDENI